MPARALQLLLPAALAGVLLCPLPSLAEPFVPRNDEEVVERLPVRIGSVEERRRQRQALERLKRQPAQMPLALQLARDAIGRARRLGDPRELGQAQAALAPWWGLADPPAPVRLLRAIVRQSQHAFGPALDDLDALLRDGSGATLPIQAQAELTRASVLQVQGRWREAADGCTRLASSRYAALGGAFDLPAQACLAELASLQGQAKEASHRMDRLAKEAGGAAAPGWLTLIRAEMAERRGDPSAEALYREALKQGTPADGVADVYPLAAYADWLLARGRGAEAVPLLLARQDADALLLRLAIAWRAAGDPRVPAAIRTLGDRFDAAAMRGDTGHGREQARFQLDLMDNPAAALRHARDNWTVQKEPADALLLVRAASAAGQPDAAEPVWRMVRDTRWEDVRLQPHPGSRSTSSGRAP